MVGKHLSPGARRAQGELRALKGLAAAALVTLAYIGSTNIIGNADTELPASLFAESLDPTLTYAGTDVVITGSIGHIFDGSTFSGPNRTAKRDRQRPEYTALEFAKGFDQLRLQVAALRAEPKLKSIDPQKRIAIAAIDPQLMAAALAAIDDVDTSKNSNLPAPLAIPTNLAYARENTPATTFKTPVSKQVSQKELWCLATAIYFEARGESYRGQVGVAQVVMNRVNHKSYPSTICGVVFQNQSRRNACQFSFACDGIPERVNEKKAWAQAEEIAKKVTGGSVYLTEVANATHYHANYVRPKWAPRMKKMTKIGLHIFYRFKKNWTQG